MSAGGRANGEGKDESGKAMQKSMMKEIEHLNDEVDFLDSSAEQDRTEKNYYKSRCETLQSNIKTLQTELIALRVTVSDQTRKYKEVRAEQSGPIAVSKLQEELNITKEQNQALDEKIGALSTTISNLERALADEKKNSEESETELAKITKQVNELKAEAKSNNKKERSSDENLRQQLEELQKDKGELQSKIDELQELHATELKRQQRKQSQALDDSQVEISNLQDKVKTLTQQLNHHKTSSEDSSEALQQQLRDLQQEVEKWRQRSDSSEKEFEEYEENIKNQQIELRNLKKQIQDITAAKDEQFAQGKEYITNLEAQHTKKIQEVVAQQQQTELQLQQEKEQLILDLQKATAAASNASSSNVSNASNEALVLQLRNEIAIYRGEISSLTSEVLELSENLTKSDKSRKKTKEKLNRKIFTLEQQLSAKPNSSNHHYTGPPRHTVSLSARLNKYISDDNDDEVEEDDDDNGVNEVNTRNRDVDEDQDDESIGSHEPRPDSAGEDEDFGGVDSASPYFMAEAPKQRAQSVIIQSKPVKKPSPTAPPAKPATAATGNRPKSKGLLSPRGSGLKTSLNNSRSPNEKAIRFSLPAAEDGGSGNGNSANNANIVSGARPKQRTSSGNRSGSAIVLKKPNSIRDLKFAKKVLMKVQDKKGRMIRTDVTKVKQDASYVLDAGFQLFCYIGKEVGEEDARFAEEFLKKFNEIEKQNIAKTMVIKKNKKYDDEEEELDEEEQDERKKTEEEEEEFFNQINSNNTGSHINSRDDGNEEEVKDLLYQFDVASDEWKHLEGVQLKKGMLSKDSCYLLDSWTECYVWRGSGTSEEVKNRAFDRAMRMFRDRKRPSWSILKKLNEGKESCLFTVKFEGDWDKKLVQSIENVGLKRSTTGPLSRKKSLFSS